ncbi:branched-chain amino acid ABC transporter permease [Proteiniclasticum sp.]|uniref:branched-chain amino acid ABC transporter permease n=1 Tax=Proteiniclasticum sp. TaxID=2053595 RepID=UPI00289E839D|nr:branched-chain amino acid ABC transporter permease [Proteiniclasticum sp.]
MQKKKTKLKLWQILIALVLAVICLFLPGIMSSYMLRVMNIALILYLCALSVYVLLGLCGQNSFAQAGLWGIGAYTAGNVIMKFGGGSLTALLISIVFTAVVSFLLGLIFFRLKNYYFTFASIGLMTILNGLFMNWTSVTGGALGMSNIKTFSLLGFIADTEVKKYFVILIVCILATVVIVKLAKSALGRSFMAIRDNELAANCLGINSLITKSIAFAISGALCGVAGYLYAFTSGYLSYQTFTYAQSTMLLIMVMLGGTASPWGALIGTLSISLLQELVRPLQDYMQLIYGLGIVILMIYQPEGIWGGVSELYDKFSTKRRKKDHTSAERAV